MVRRKKWLIRSGCSLLLITGILWGLPHFMQPHAPLPAKVLMVEGWMPIESLIEAGQWARKEGYEQVFSTGGIREGAMFIPRKGELSWQTGLHMGTMSTLRIRAWGTSCQGGFPVLEIWVNEEWEKSIELSQYNKWYEIQVPTKELSSIKLVYTNDLRREGEDRNIFIEQIFVGNRTLTNDCWAYTYGKSTSFTDFLCGDDARRGAKVMETVAPELKYIAVASEHVGELQTHHRAEALAQCIAQKYPDIRRANLVAYKYHSRRSWELYRHSLKDIEVGIISLGKNNRANPSWETKYEAFSTLMLQFFKYLYTRILFL